MARKPLTKEQIAARTAKAQATKAAKKKAALEALGLEQFDRTKKTRKKRTMTAAQKKAASDRLAKARAAKGPSANMSVDESIRNLPDTDPFAPPRVRGWIKNTQDKLRAMKHMKDSKDAKERLAYMTEETYLANLQAYLRTGVYADSRWGAERQHKVTNVVRAMAYNKDGTPKRTVGFWYPDIGEVYTQEMANEDHAR